MFGPHQYDKLNNAKLIQDFEKFPSQILSSEKKNISHTMIGYTFNVR